MGKVHSIEQLAVSTPSYPGQWILQGRTDYCQLVRNRDTGFVAEEYIVPADPRIPLMRTFEIYDHRRQQNDYLVEVYQVERQPPSYICQGGDYLRVKTERIPTRLSEIKYLDENKGLVVLEQALIGYKSIFTFQGPVLINDDMIGFNQNGKVKVWLNNNFAKNTPDGELNPPRYQENTYHGSGITNEAGMVSQVVDVVQQHVDPNQFKDFMNLFYATSPRSFVQALQLIKQYCATRNANVPRVSIPTIQTINTQPQSQTIIIQNSLSPSINKSLQAPTQPYIIQNFAPEQPIITYQQLPPTTYYVQQPVSQIQIVQQEPRTNYVQIVNQQPPSLIYQQPSNIVHPRSTIIPQRQSIINQQHPVIHQRPHPQHIQRQSIQQFDQHHSQPNHFVQPIQQVQRVEPIHQVQQIQHVKQIYSPQQVSLPVIQTIQPQPQLIQSPVQLPSVAVTPTSQIAINNVRLNDTVHASSQIVNPVSQIVTPSSQLVTATSQINTSPGIPNQIRPNHRLSYPSPRAVQNQIRVSPMPFRNNLVDKSLSPFVSRERITNKKSSINIPNRDPSPTIFRPRASPNQSNISPIGIAAPKIVTNINRNLTPQIVYPHSQLSKVSPKREQYRKSQVKDPHPTHSIGKALRGIQKTNSINDPFLDRISPTLVTAQNIVKVQETKTQAVRAHPIRNITTQKVQQKQQLTSFSGLPHKRTNIHQTITRPNIPVTAAAATEIKQVQVNQPTLVNQPKVQRQTQIVHQTQTTQQQQIQQQQKVTIAAQQARLDKLQKDIKKTLVDFSNPFGRQTQPNTNHISAPTQAPIFPSRPGRPTQPKQQIPVQVQPHSQPNSLFASFNYQPFKQIPQHLNPPHRVHHQPQTINVVEQRSIFELGDNISGIRVDPITGASGVSTFTNPLLEQRAQVNVVVFTEVKSLATYDSVHPEIRKLMMLPKNQHFQPQPLQPQPQLQPAINRVIETTTVTDQIIQNIPVAQSHQLIHQAQTILTNTQTIAQINQPQIIVQQTIEIVETNYQNANEQIQTQQVDVRVTKNDLWTSNDSLSHPIQNAQIRIQGQPASSISETLMVNQTIRQNPSEGRTQRTGLDIESLMRKHNEESKNLFEKYQQYGRNIERQLSPNTPTSPSSLPKQPQIRYGGIIVENQPITYADQRSNGVAYEHIQTTQFYEVTNREHHTHHQMYENYYNQQQQIYQQQQQNYEHQQLAQEQQRQQEQRRQYQQQYQQNVQQQQFYQQQKLQQEQLHYEQLRQQQIHQQQLKSQQLYQQQLHQQRLHQERLYEEQLHQQKLAQQKLHQQQQLYQQQIQQQWEQKYHQQQQQYQYENQQINHIQDYLPTYHQPVIIHQQVAQHQYTFNSPNTYTLSTGEYITSNEPNRYQTQYTESQVIQTYDHGSSRQSRGYQYVATTEHNDITPSYGNRNGDYFRKDDLGIGESVHFKKTTQSYVYGDVEEIAENNIQEIRGSAPTYEELRAALLETNIGLERQTETYQEYTTEYRYETTAYEDRT